MELDQPADGVRTTERGPQGLRTRGPRGWARVAAAQLGVQVALIVGFSVLYLAELIQGQGDDRTRVIMSIVLFLTGAVLPCPPDPAAPGPAVPADG